MVTFELVPEPCDLDSVFVYEGLNSIPTGDFCRYV